MKKQIIYLFLIFALTKVQAQNMDFTNYTRKSYPDSLNKLTEIIINKKKPSDSLLYYCFPKDSSEAIFLFLIDYRKEERYNGVIYQINKYWVEKCINKNKKYIKQFIRLSEFVDGYFATDYFLNIEWIIKKTGNTFCEVLKECLPEHKRRLLLTECVIEKCNVKLLQDTIP